MIGIYVFIAVVLVTAVFLLGEQLRSNVENLEQWAAALGPYAIIGFILIYALLAMVFVPDTLLGIIAGAAFGFTQGVVVAIVGSLLAASIQFYLSHHLIKPVIDRKIAAKPGLQAIQHAVHKQQLKMQFLIRLTPLNRTFCNYLLGGSGVNFKKYILATTGFLPHLLVEVYFGFAGKQLANTASQSDQHMLIQDLAMGLGVIVAVVVIYLVSKTAKNALEKAARN